MSSKHARRFVGPALIVLAAGLAALTFVKLDRSGIIRVGYSMAGYTTAE